MGSGDFFLMGAIITCLWAKRSTSGEEDRFLMCREGGDCRAKPLEGEKGRLQGQSPGALGAGPDFVHRHLGSLRERF